MVDEKEKGTRSKTESPADQNNAAPAISSRRVKAKEFVELCGRHPFATGLFALLSLFGLAFSFYTFAWDRSQSEKTTAQIDTVSDSIRQVEDRIAQADPDVTDSRIEIPIRISMKAGDIDNVIFDADNPVTAEHLNWEAAETAIERIRKTWPHSSSDPYYSFSVASIADKNFVQIAPYIVLDVFKVTSISKDLAAISLFERGGGAILREFEGQLIPVEGLQIAPMWDGMAGDYKQDIDYISMQPGEVEEFFLSLNFLPDYYYDFRIGLQIKFNGQNSIVWNDQEYRRGFPSHEILLFDASSDVFKLKVHPEAEYTLPKPEYFARYRRDIARYRQSRVFNLEALGVEGPVLPPER